MDVPGMIENNYHVYQYYRRLANQDQHYMAELRLMPWLKLERYRAQILAGAFTRVREGMVICIKLNNRFLMN
jgi:hypothetical protein